MLVRIQTDPAYCDRACIMGSISLSKNSNLWALKLLASASMVAMVGWSGAAIAQEDDDTAVLDTVVVKGIRASLEKSADVKRNSDGVVDAIVAEDIGKFPDTNLAESLQRITGVSIDRANGEGSTVTVRGFGADFNLVTLNGRQMPTSSLGDGASAPSSRSYDFANIASEGISGVEVYKTGQADVPSGGIGSTINILTTRPLDAPGQKGSVGAKMVMDTSRNDGTSYTPEFSGIYSNTFMDDKFGVSLSASYQKREASVNSASSTWRDGYLGGNGTSVEQCNWGSLASNTNCWNYNPGASVANPPGDGDVYAVPQEGSYSLTDIDRERTNAQLTLQYRPISTLTATLDYTYSENTIEARTAGMGVWFDHNFNNSAWTDGPVAGIEFYSETFGNPTDLSYSGALTANQSVNDSLGLNFEWEATDALTLEFDYHNSTAESKPTNPYGSSVSVGSAVYGVETQTIDYSQDLPIISYVNAAGTDVEDLTQRIATGSAFRNAYFKNDIEQAQIDGSYDFDNSLIDSLDFGVSMIDSKVRSAFGVLQNDTWGGIGTAADIPDGADFWTYHSLTDAFDGVDGVNDPNLPAGFYSFPFEQMVALMDSGNLAGAGAGICGGDGNCLADFTTDRRIQEETVSAYIQANFDFDMFGRPAYIVTGVRYEETDITSSALVPIPVNTTWPGLNEFSYLYGPDSDFTTVEGSYDYWLPAFDFRIDATDDIVLRASYSQTITRPTYANLQGGLTIDSPFRTGDATGSSGNPSLLPYESENIDLSAEWYYDDASYFSVGYFTKDVSNFIGQGTIRQTAFDLVHPGLGDRVAAAEAALGAGATVQDIKDYIIANYPSTVDPTTGLILGDPGSDPLVEFEVRVPSNSDQAATINGWEIALQHTFGETGFGTILNYTIVEGDATYDNTQAYTVTQFALPGLSNSANAVLFYDKGPLQGRIAYNWRDEFYAGGDINPFYTEAYGQFDFSASYEIREGLTAFIEGINITGEQRRGHRRHPNTVTFVSPGDARYNLGLRYNF